MNYDIIVAIVTFLTGLTMFVKKIYPKIISLLNSFKTVVNYISANSEIIGKSEPSKTTKDPHLTSLEDKIDRITNEILPENSLSLREVALYSLNLATISEERSKYLLESHDIPTYECNVKTGECTWVNPALCNLFGIGYKSMLGKGWLAGLDPNEATICWEHFQKAIRIDMPYSWTYTIINQITGRQISCKTTATVIRDQNNFPILLRGIVTEIDRQHE